MRRWALSRGRATEGCGCHGLFAQKHFSLLVAPTAACEMLPGVRPLYTPGPHLWSDRVG